MSQLWTTLKRRGTGLLDDFIDRPILWLLVFAIFGISISNLIYTTFYTSSIPLISGIGFTMLGFGITATSILMSLMSSPIVIRMRASKTLWTQLSNSFTRSNIIFLLIGIYGLSVSINFIDDNTAYANIFRAIYVSLLSLSLYCTITIIYVLHKILAAPLTADEEEDLRQKELSRFPVIDPLAAINTPSPTRTMSIRPQQTPGADP